MKRTRRNMLLYVTATSMVGLACESHKAVGDVAPSPDLSVGKVAVAPDAAPVVPDPAPSAGDPVTVGTIAAPFDVDAGRDAGATSDAGSGTKGATPKPKYPHPPGKVARPPDW